MSFINNSSLGRIGYTCPKIDELTEQYVKEVLQYVGGNQDTRNTVEQLLYDMAEDFKQNGTIPLRVCLDEACDEISELESDLKYANKQIDQQQDEIDYLRAEVEMYEADAYNRQID